MKKLNWAYIIGYTSFVCGISFICWFICPKFKNIIWVNQRVTDANQHTRPANTLKIQKAPDTNYNYYKERKTPIYAAHYGIRNKDSKLENMLRIPGPYLYMKDRQRYIKASQEFERNVKAYINQKIKKINI